MSTDTTIQTDWYTVAEAAPYAKRNVQTIAAALRDGTLKGHQRVKKGKWLIHRADLDAYIRGEVADVKPERVTRRRAS